MIPETVPAANPLILALAGGFEFVTSTSTGAGSVALPFIYYAAETCQAVACSEIEAKNGRRSTLVSKEKTCQ